MRSHNRQSLPARPSTFGPSQFQRTFTQEDRYDLPPPAIAVQLQAAQRGHSLSTTMLHLAEGGLIQPMMNDHVPLPLGPYDHYEQKKLDALDRGSLHENFSIPRSISMKLYKIGNSSAAYNCHDWSVGYTTAQEAVSGRSIDDFDRFYRKYGLVRTEGEAEAYVAIYGKAPDNLDHAAVRLDGFWTSKLGPGCVLVHEHLSFLEGDDKYGKVQYFYKR